MKADMGGYNFQSTVNGLSQAILQNLRSIYGYNLLTVTGASATENERFSAWLGNRDNSAIAFALMTGTPAYYDTRPGDITVTSGTTTTTCTRTCGALATGVTGPTNDGVDGGNTTRQYYVANGSGQYCNPTGTLSANCAGAGGTVADPAPCGTAGFLRYLRAPASTNTNNPHQHLPQSGTTNRSPCSPIASLPGSARTVPRCSGRSCGTLPSAASPRRRVRTTWLGAGVAPPSRWAAT